jgi:hypothetical protein
MLRNGKVIEGKTISEIGVFSSIFISSDHQDPIENHAFEILMRTKAAHCNEGGISTGYSVYDQPLLVKNLDITRDVKPSFEGF